MTIATTSWKFGADQGPANARENMFESKTINTVSGTVIYANTGGVKPIQITITGPVAYEVVPLGLTFGMGPEAHKQTLEQEMDSFMTSAHAMFRDFEAELE